MIIAATESWVPPAELEAQTIRGVGRAILRMVVELPPSLWAWPGELACKQRTAQHARFVENLADIVWSVGAEPLLRGSDNR